VVSDLEGEMLPTSLLLVGDSQLLAAFGAAAVEDVAAGRRGHTGAEAVCFGAFALIGLPGTFHFKTPYC
jgi:hypothetical protein